MDGNTLPGPFSSSSQRGRQAMMWTHTKKFLQGPARLLGLSTNTKKNATGTLAEFLGTEIDIIRMEARLPQDKLEKAKTWVTKTLNPRKISRTNLRSLLGFLSFACKVVIPGRTFLRWLFNALAEKGTDSEKRVRLPWTSTKLSSGTLNLNSKTSEYRWRSATS